MALELFMKEKLLSLHGVQRINDMEGNEVFEVRGKFFSIHDYMSLYDMEGKELARIHKKVFSLHETHFIEMDGKEVTELRTKLFHPFNQEIDRPEIGWQIRGNFLEHDFSIYDKEDQLRAVVHRKYISLGEGWPSSWPWSALWQTGATPGRAAPSPQAPPPRPTPTSRARTTRTEL